MGRRRMGGGSMFIPPLGEIKETDLCVLEFFGHFQE